LKKLTKNTKTLIYSAAGLLLLVAAFIVLLVTQVPEEDEPPPPPEDNSHLIFADLSPLDVASISVKNADAEYTIEQIKDEVFDIEALLSAPRNNDRLRDAARYMATLRARQIVEENETDFDKYGLGGSAIEVAVVFKNGEKQEYLIGDKTPTTEDMTYVRIKGDSTVYAVWSYYVNFTRGDLSSFVSLELTEEHQAAGSPTVEKLSVQRKGQETYLFEAIPPLGENDVMTSFNQHKVVSPVQAELGYFEAERIIFGLFGLRAMEVYHLGEELPDDEIAGLNEPTAVVEMTVGKDDTELIIGNPIYETITGVGDNNIDIVTGYYCVFSAYPDVVFIISVDFLPWLNFDIERLMATGFHMPNILHVGALVIQTPAHDLSFTFTGDTYTEQYFLDGELQEALRFKSLYQYVIAASAEALFKGDPEAVKDMPLLASYTFSYRENFNRPDDVVEFYDSGDRRIVIAFNGEPRFTCRAMYATRLEQNLDAYLKGEEIILSW